MKIISLNIPDILIIEPKLFEDDRGVFFESFNLEAFREATKLNIEFVQENHSISHKGVLRGLHYQLPPCVQGKLVRVIQGEVFDVAVDMRRSSSTFGQYVSHILSAENKKQMWIPEGFAHGFLTLSQTSEFLYKTTASYSAKDEECIIWNDDFLKILWPLNLPIKISSKDSLGKPFREARLFD
jgi:dTDP-4-dehydrorhamnose 3,5-epimerase